MIDDVPLPYFTKNTVGHKTPALKRTFFYFPLAQGIIFSTMYYLKILSKMATRKEFCVHQVSREMSLFQLRLLLVADEGTKYVEEK